MTTVRDLLDDGSCRASCVTAATTARRCTCPCGGLHHGLLALASIDALLEARSSGLNSLLDLEILNAQ